MQTPKLLLTVNHLIAQGLSAYHIQQALQYDGHKVWCFGSYYTTGKTAKNRICFYHTDKGVKAHKVN